MATSRSLGRPSATVSTASCPPSPPEGSSVARVYTPRTSCPTTATATILRPPLGCKSQKFGLEVWGDPNKAKIAGNKKIEVMWYMGLKKGPLQGLCLVFCVLWTARYLLGAPAGYPPPGHALYLARQDTRTNYSHISQKTQSQNTRAHGPPFLPFSLCTSQFFPTARCV